MGGKFSTLWMTKRPNMAVGRTRGLLAGKLVQCAGRGLEVESPRGGRSPLNAVALGCQKARGKEAMLRSTVWQPNRRV
jgi:hypothetical protein